MTIRNVCQEAWSKRYGDSLLTSTVKLFAHRLGNGWMVQLYAVARIAYQLQISEGELTSAT